MLGVELEHFIIDRDTGAAVPYSGDCGVQEILTRLMALRPDAAVLPDDGFFGFQVPEFTLTLKQGESILRQIYENGHLEEWNLRYLAEDEGPSTELNWTIDVDDTDGKDVLLISGNWKFPPNGWMDEILKAVRTGEPDFGKCFKDLA